VTAGHKRPVVGPLVPRATWPGLRGGELIARVEQPGQPDLERRHGLGPAAANAIPLDANSAEFFNQVAVTASSTPAAAATELQAAGD
jgi:hypothetical protein